MVLRQIKHDMWLNSNNMAFEYMAFEWRQTFFSHILW